MIDSMSANHLDAVFQALGNAKRRGMLRTLSFGPATVTQLAHEHELSLPAIHKHLKSLEAAGLVVRRKAGRVNFVAMNKTSVREMQDWINQYRVEWGNEQETLDNYIAWFNQ
jgi:DNA-binding transcriptional ArsR family regulator